MAHKAVHNLAPPFSALSLSLGPLQPTDLLSLQRAKQILLSLHLLLSHVGSPSLSPSSLQMSPPQKDLLTSWGPHHYTPSWMSFLLYLSTAHSPNMVCRLPPRYFLCYFFLFLPLSAEDRIQGLALSKHSATKPHPPGPLLLSSFSPTFTCHLPRDVNTGFLSCLPYASGPTAGVPSFCPLHTVPSTQERPNVTLRK